MMESITKERLATLSDGIFAVIITIMVLQLHSPAEPSFKELLKGWPTAVSYAVSYVLIVVMWINHHFLWGFAERPTPRLILWNFLHMFAASLVPFATAWVADARMDRVPVFVYAATIVMVNLSYHAFAYEVLPDAPAGCTRLVRRTTLLRSAMTLGLFSGAMLLSLKFPHVGFWLVTTIVLTYARPEAPLRRATVHPERAQSP